MGADNWTTCPKCLDDARKREAREREAVELLYGQISIADFDLRRAAVVTVAEGDYTTFREDYEVNDAETGEVCFTYRGGCTKCGLTAQLEATKKFWP